MNECKWRHGIKGLKAEHGGGPARMNLALRRTASHPPDIHIEAGLAPF